MVKNYILDTNICLSDAKNLFGFDDNNVILTNITIQELNRKKSYGGEVGYQARECARFLEDLRKRGDLSKGVKLDNGGTLRIYYPNDEALKKPHMHLNGFDMSNPDARIIQTCKLFKLEEARQGEATILVTSDKCMRIAAAIAKVQVEEYKNEQVETTGYTGHRDLNVPTEYIENLYKNKESDELPDDEGTPFTENEFITMHSGKLIALTVYRKGRIYLIPDQKIYNGFVPANKMQTYALWALNQEDIPMVILLGSAGAAKTFLSLAVGLDKTYVDLRKRAGRYNRILISRPNAEAGDPSFGYLPGTLEEKMTPLLLPYTDNLETLLAGTGKQKETREQVQIQIEDLFESGVLEVCALSYIRGRSLNDVYIICDEFQNATRSLTRDVASRIGKGSKLVIAGDPTQCDAPTLDSRNNGLIFAKESMKGSPLCAIITFDSTNTVRSELAKTVVERMKL